MRNLSSPKGTPIAERMARLSMPIPESGCIIWMGSINWGGYGRFAPTPGRNTGAHRVAYELAKGPIPEGLQIDHKCRVRSCINPDHLEAVTFKENILRGVSPSAKHAKKTHCPNGHPYDRQTKRKRWCQVCVNVKSRDWRRNQSRNRKATQP